MRGRTIRIQMDVDLSAMPGANFTLHRLMLAEFDGHSHPVGSEKSLGMERGAERAAGGTVVGGEVGAASVGGEREGGGGGRDGDDGDGDGDGKVPQGDSGGMGAGEVWARRRARVGSVAGNSRCVMHADILVLLLLYL